MNAKITLALSLCAALGLAACSKKERSGERTEG